MDAVFDCLYYTGIGTEEVKDMLVEMQGRVGIVGAWGDWHDYPKRAGVLLTDTVLDRPSREIDMTRQVGSSAQSKT